LNRPTKEPNKAEFLIITKAKDLVKHTDLMTSERRFPKKYRFTLVNRLQDRTLFIYECIQEANELDLSDPAEFRERQQLQKKALTACKIVLFFIELALEKGLITNEQCEAWGKYVLDVKYMTANWTKKDRERFNQNKRTPPGY